MFLELKVFAHSVGVTVDYNLDVVPNPIIKSVGLRRNLLEAILIFPNPLYIKAIIKTTELANKHLVTDKEIFDYIQLTRFLGYDNLDRMSCDWCSVVNGFCEFLLASIEGNSVENILKLKNVYFVGMFNTLKLVLKLKNSVDPTESYIVSDEYVSQFIQSKNIKNFQGDVEFIKLIKFFIEFRNLVACIESRWCPFNYLKAIAYHRDYWGSDIEKISKTLQEKGKIVCNECVDFLNKTHGIDGTMKENVFKDLLLKLACKHI
jgi:hypothetical protein